MNGNDIIEYIENNYELVFDSIREKYPHMMDEDIDNDFDLQHDTAMDLLF